MPALARMRQGRRKVATWPLPRKATARLLPGGRVGCGHTSSSHRSDSLGQDNLCLFRQISYSTIQSGMQGLDRENPPALQHDRTDGPEMRHRRRPGGCTRIAAPRIRAGTGRGSRASAETAGEFRGADDGIRTRDPHLGKVMRYQLRYIRTRITASVMRHRTLADTRGKKPIAAHAARLRRRPSPAAIRQARATTPTNQGNTVLRPQVVAAQPARMVGRAIAE